MQSQCQNCCDGASCQFSNLLHRDLKQTLPWLLTEILQGVGGLLCVGDPPYRCSSRLREAWRARSSLNRYHGSALIALHAVELTYTGLGDGSGRSVPLMTRCSVAIRSFKAMLSTACCFTALHSTDSSFSQIRRSTSAHRGASNVGAVS